MEEEDTQHTIAVNPAKAIYLTFGKMNETPDECQEKQQHHGTTHESFLLTHGAEDEVGVLLRDIFQLGLRTVQETFAFQPT